MIIPADICHEKEIVSLWHTAFGDKEEDVQRYLKTILKYFLIYEEGGIVKGMLSVLPVSLREQKGGYIYAVVTHPDYRGQGICNSLMEYLKSGESYDFLVLVPQNKGLFDFYKRMGFKKVSFLKKEEIKSFSGIKEEYAMNKLSPNEYEKARNHFYKNCDFIKWDSQMLAFAKDMYNGDFYEILKGKGRIGYTFLYRENESVFIKELLCENHREVAENIGALIEAEKVNVAFENKESEPTFMVYPKTFANVKFGIYLD